MKDETFIQMLKRDLIERDYEKDTHPNHDHLTDHAIRRDRILYFTLQMQAYWDDEPWDLPPSYNGVQYRALDLMKLPIKGCTDLEALHELLTGLEAEVILAAQRRGFRLKRRRCDYDDSGERRGHARRRGGGDELER